MLDNLDGRLLANKDAMARCTFEVTLAFDRSIIFSRIVGQFQAKPFSCSNMERTDVADSAYTFILSFDGLPNPEEKIGHCCLKRCRGSLA